MHRPNADRILAPALCRHAGGHERIEGARSRWGDTLPGNPQDLWTWCLEQDRDVLIDLLAFCAAVSIDAVIRKRGSKDPRTLLAHADDLAIELGLDIAQWFTPDAANYFSQVTKAQILDALREAKGGVAPAWAKMKKAELASVAERAVAGTGWLPALLRSPTDESAEDRTDMQKAA